jgi:hypothetical protein
MKHVAILAAGFALAALSARAEEADHAHLESIGEWPVCVTFNHIDRSPKKIVDNLDKVEILVPTVPPEEATYLEKETHDAVTVQSEQRFNIAAARPYYPAWSLHSNFAKTRRKLETYKLSQFHSLALIQHFLRKEISSTTSLFYYLSDAEVAWSEFESTPNVRIPPSPVVKNPRYLMGSNILELTEYVNCLLDLLDGGSG